jgi:hypothetical protein
MRKSLWACMLSELLGRMAEGERGLPHVSGKSQQRKHISPHYQIEHGVESAL